MAIPITPMIHLLVAVASGALLTGAVTLILTSRLRRNIARARRVKERLRKLSGDQEGVARTKR
jgi:hypothetical protein